MEKWATFGTLAAGVLCLGGIILASIASEKIPTSLTQEEMRRTPTGAPCSPDVCAQMITEKQRSSEGFMIMMVGVAFLGLVLVTFCSCCAFLICCPKRVSRVMSLEMPSEQTDPQPMHSPSTTGAQQPTSVANAPQGLPQP